MTHAVSPTMKFALKAKKVQKCQATDQKMICEKSSKNGKCSGGRLTAPLARVTTLLGATLLSATASRTEVTRITEDDPDLTARSRPSGSGNIRWIHGFPVVESQNERDMSLRHKGTNASKAITLLSASLHSQLQQKANLIGAS